MKYFEPEAEREKIEYQRKEVQDSRVGNGKKWDPASESRVPQGKQTVLQLIRYEVFAGPPVIGKVSGEVARARQQGLAEEQKHGCETKEGAVLEVARGH